MNLSTKSWLLIAAGIWCVVIGAVVIFGEPVEEVSADNAKIQKTVENIETIQQDSVEPSSEEINSDDEETDYTEPVEPEVMPIEPEPVQNYTTAPEPIVYNEPVAVEDPNLPLKARCKDDTIQYQDDPSGPNYRGMCSSHGGIAEKLGRVP